MPSPNASKAAAPKGHLLALETSGRQGSIAAIEVGASEPKALLTRELPPQDRSARTLVPTIQGLLGEIGWSPHDIQAVAVALGPGSFTGLRVGVTTAKTLAYVSDAALVSVNTLDALAEPFWLEKAPAGAPLWSVLDAQRNEVFAARYVGPPNEETLIQRLTQAEFFSKLKPGDRVVAPHAFLLSQRYESNGVQWVTAQTMADSVARLAVAKWQAGQLAEPFQLAPQYYRPSAAEENLR